ncbi:MAG: dihydroxyacetone kinase subunit DhaL [Streptosporangiales bacterium]
MTVAGIDVRAVVEAFAAAVAEHRDELTELDSAIGDGDHGTNLHRGMRAAVEKIAGADDSDPAGTLRAVGMALISKVGGASGPLFGTFFLEAGKALHGANEVGGVEWAAAVEAAVRGVRARGKAEVGDKTMVDALVPARDAQREAVDSGASLADAARRAADAAEQGRDATVPLVARKGRASYLGERSAGHVDPGATSTALLFRAVAESLPR